MESYFYDVDVWNGKFAKRIVSSVKLRRCCGSPILLLSLPEQMRREEDVEDHPYPFQTAHKIDTEQTDCRWNMFSFIIDHVQVLFIAMTL